MTRTKSFDQPPKALPKQFNSGQWKLKPPSLHKHEKINHRFCFTRCESGFCQPTKYVSYEFQTPLHIYWVSPILQWQKQLSSIASAAAWWSNMAMTEYGLVQGGPVLVTNGVIARISRVMYNHSYPFQKPFIGVITPVTTGSSPPCCISDQPIPVSKNKNMWSWRNRWSLRITPRCTTFQHLALRLGNSGWGADVTYSHTPFSFNIQTLVEKRIHIFKFYMRGTSCF